MSTAFIPKQLADRSEFAAQGATPSARYLSFGTFLLDLQRQELYKSGTRVKLQGKVCEALMALLERPGDVLTREELRMRLWPQDRQVNYDANVNTTVNKLRQVLGDTPDQPAFVETIPRKGYCFVAKVYCSDDLPLDFKPIQSEAAANAISNHPSMSPSSLLSGIATTTWFRASIVALVVAGMLLGAAIALFMRRGI